MTLPRFRIRTLMIAVALTGMILAVTVFVLQDYHFHDFYFTIR